MTRLNAVDADAGLPQKFNSTLIHTSSIKVGHLLCAAEVDKIYFRPLDTFFVYRRVRHTDSFQYDCRKHYKITVVIGYGTRKPHMYI